MLTEDEKCQEFLEAASQYEEDSIHLEDLYKADANIQQIKTEKHTYRIVPCHLQFHNLVTLFRAAIDGFLTLLTDWTLPFTHPLNW
ncbi:22342_t:CDS:1, partial [Racocetra persica]